VYCLVEGNPLYIFHRSLLALRHWGSTFAVYLFCYYSTAFCSLVKGYSVRYPRKAIAHLNIAGKALQPASVSRSALRAKEPVQASREA